MSDQKIIIVHLRRPRDEDDPREDPFWEFGSFGITGCHNRNLLNPKKAEELIGVRLAFAQGGPLGTKLIFVTPPLRPPKIYEQKSKRTCEVLWSPNGMPFRYSSAPLLIDNKGRSNFPALKRAIARIARKSWAGKFSSKFRSTRRPLESSVANEVIRTYDRLRKAAPRKDIAKNYVGAFSTIREPVSARDREEAYEKLREQAGKIVF
jgi:hypothetical protein